MADANRRIVLAARPHGVPVAGDFRLEQVPVPDPDERQIVVRTQWLSVDPYMRGRMNEGASYAPGLELGQVMTGGGVGAVVASRHPGFREGDIVQGTTGWQDHAVLFGDEVRRVDPDLAPVSTALGVLGMPGLTAYFGLLDVTAPVAGETVVVSGAAGAVGSLVGQIARIQGARAIGIAGGPAKVAWITDELGFDGGIDYKAATDLGDDLERLCPTGVDVYFDNVGGPVSDAVIPRMNPNGRISVCGQISQYNATETPVGPRLTWHFITKRLTMRGFLVFDFAERYAEGLEALSGWYRDGRLRTREDVVTGLENAPAAFIGMLGGDNIGKRLVKLP